MHHSESKHSKRKNVKKKLKQKQKELLKRPKQLLKQRLNVKQLWTKLRRKLNRDSVRQNKRKPNSLKQKSKRCLLSNKLHNKRLEFLKLDRIVNR